MPATDTLVILLPKAIDLGKGTIAVRGFPLRLFVNREQYFRILRIEKINYSPAWARVELMQVISGFLQESVTGEGGVIDVQADVTDREPADFVLVNNSIDAEVRFTLHFRAWQHGEV